MPSYTEIQEMHRLQDLNKQKRNSPTDEEWASHLRIQHTISMRLEDLVKGDDWATYLSHLKTLLDEDKEQLEIAKARLLEANCVGEEVDKVRLVIQYWRGRTLAREQDIELPNTLIERNTELQEKQKVLDTTETS